MLVTVAQDEARQEMRTFALILMLGIAVLFFGAIIFKDEVTSLISQMSLSTPSESNEVLGGCVGFYSANNRWPKTEADIRAGLKIAHRDPKYLPTLKKLTLIEKGGSLTVSFTSKDGLKMELNLDAKTKMPTSEPTGPSGRG